jgi:hypothetical protein
MTLIDDFLLSGRAADFILALVVLEAVLLGLRARRGEAPATARWLSPWPLGQHWCWRCAWRSSTRRRP